MGLGTYLGHFVSQNGKGHVLGHVKDLGDDAKQIDKVRIYRTNARYGVTRNEGIPSDQQCSHSLGNISTRMTVIS
jgi:hypothetical protein